MENVGNKIGDSQGKTENEINIIAEGKLLILKAIKKVPLLTIYKSIGTC